MIGTLTLMITSLALTGMGVGRDDESIQRAEEYVALEKGRSELLKKADELKKLLQRAQRVKEKVAMLETLLKSQSAAAELEERTIRLKVQLKSRETRVSDLQKELARLKKELDSLRQEMVKRQQKFSREFVKVLPPEGDYSTRFKPWFVEAGKTGVTVYDGAKPWMVLNSRIKTDEKFNEFLKKLADSDSSQLVVLVRSTGLTAMNIVIAQAEGMGIDCGKLPLVGAGEVDLSSFQK
jgi:hypothetical protein